MGKEPDPVAEATGEWGTFELRLAALVSTMADGGSFSLHVPCNAGAIDEFTIMCSDGCDSVSIESPSWGTTSLEFVADGPDDVAGRGKFVGEALVGIIRDEYGLPDPGLMTTSAPAGCRHRLSVLGLTERSAVSDDQVLVDQRVDEGVQWPTSYDELYAIVYDYLRDQYDSEVVPDEDGDFPIEVDGVRLWVKVVKDQPAILFRAPAVVGVRSQRQADTELNVANRNSYWLRWSRRKRTVWQELTLLARPFVPEQFDGMLRLFVTSCADTRPDLADRLYGQPAW